MIVVFRDYGVECDPSRSVLEFSSQNVPVVTDNYCSDAEVVSDVPSRPLFELEQMAPIIHAGVQYRDVRYPMSNDGNAIDYASLRARILTDEYRKASNRVAILCGESSLSTSIFDIPEDTIVIVDIDVAMCDFMRRYVNALRTSDSPSDMLDRLHVSSLDQTYGQDVITRLLLQRDHWQEKRGFHSFDDDELFRRASKLAREKSIVVWNADLTDELDMADLGDALRRLDATVTMMNITNVPAVSVQAGLTTEQLACSLHQLPQTTDAPIMAASRSPIPGSKYIVEPLGPFFGIDNLLAHGGDISELIGGPIIKREYCDTLFDPRTVELAKELVRILIGVQVRM